jgi:hypothetical protein
MESSSNNVEFITLEAAAAMTKGTRITFIPGTSKKSQLFARSIQ